MEKSSCYSFKLRYDNVDHTGATSLSVIYIIKGNWAKLTEVYMG
jgi:hypothetical protein